MYYWSRADAKSKRPADRQHVFVSARWGLGHKLAAKHLDLDVRNVGRHFAALVEAGLAARGEAKAEGKIESGIWLADVENFGHFAQAKPPCSTGETAMAEPPYSGETTLLDRRNRHDGTALCDRTDPPTPPRQNRPDGSDGSALRSKEAIPAIPLPIQAAQRQVDHEAIQLSQQDLAAERAAQREANERERIRAAGRLPAPVDEQVVEQHWLTVATQDLAYFALLGDQNAKWRAKTEETMGALGWSRGDVIAMLRGCDAEQAEMRQAGTLAGTIANQTFPKATHVFARGFEAPWIHATAKVPWSEWAYKRWAVPAKQATEVKPERWADKVRRENRERREDNARRRGAVAP